MSTSGKAGGPAVPVTVGNGGTGDTTLTAHGVLIGEGASAVAVTSAGTAGQVLTSNGAAADPTFQAGGGGAISTATATIANTAINTLFSSPTQLVAAPGANAEIVVVNATLEGVPGAAGNWSANGNLGIFWGTSPAAGGTAAPVTGAPDMLTATALPNVAQVNVGIHGQDLIFARSAAVNKALTFGMLTADPQKVGALTAITIANGGAGYVANDTGTIDMDFYGGAATYTVTTVGALGVVTGITLGTGGTGYGQGDTLNTTAGGGQPGIGTGLTLTATAVVQPLGNLYVTVAYYVVTTH